MAGKKVADSSLFPAICFAHSIRVILHFGNLMAFIKPCTDTLKQRNSGESLTAIPAASLLRTSIKLYIFHFRTYIVVVKILLSW